MNETRISANRQNLTATVEDKSFIADINKDYCLINLEHETFKVDAKHFRAMFLTFEIADQLTEEK